VRCRVHRPMKHVHGYFRRHWMPPSGNYWPCITPVDAMVINLGVKLWRCEISVPKQAFKRHKTNPLLSSSKQQVA